MTPELSHRTVLASICTVLHKNAEDAAPHLLQPNRSSNHTGHRQAAISTTRHIPINKGFYFKHVKSADPCDNGFGFITFSRPKVGHCYTYVSTGRDLEVCINEQSVIVVKLQVIRLSFGLDLRSVKWGEHLESALSSLLAGVPKIDMKSLQLVRDNNNVFIESFFQQSRHLKVELAFRREALLRNELLNMTALTKIDARLNRLIAGSGQDLALRTLKNSFFPSWRSDSNDSRGLLSSLDPPSLKGQDFVSQMWHIDVTPTRILLAGPQWHISNRVIREHKDHWHHFARVTFTNEDRESVTTIMPNYGFEESSNYIKGRVLNILKFGLENSSSRWINADVIRNSLGDFSDVITSPARYGARFSQALSATARTIKVPRERLQHTEDISMPDGTSYTDGVGQISTELMAEVWQSYSAVHGEHRKRLLLKASAPSANQIRLGRNKGMLCVNPKLRGKVLFVRPSMTKFGSQHQDLEVANSSSCCLPARLNRPLVNALGDRGVSPTAFLEIQQEAISHIGMARTNFKETAKLCSAYSFGTGCNLRVLFKKLHKLGLAASAVNSDSFILTLAKSVTAAALGDMKRKVRIPVSGLTLLGVADEFGFLKEGEVFVQVETVESGDVSRRILTGRRLIRRSPTIDPGDVVMATCVRPPPGHPLLQLRNVIVFDTCSRIQPLPRRLGGGDLDGDDFTVYEDSRLFPPTDYPNLVTHTKTTPKSVHRPCSPNDLATFFCDFMLNDIIGMVSYLHLRIADASPHGSNDLGCKKLTILHSLATDFRKTGVAVERDELLRSGEPIVPDFLAQGEPREGKLIYSSSKVLGYMYRAVSWGETDTPSLDSNTDPETGLMPVDEAANAEWDGVNDGYSDYIRLFDDRGSSYHDGDADVDRTSLRSLVNHGPTDPSGSSNSANEALQSRLGPRIASQPESSTGSTVVAASSSPWPFRDVTFPPVFERIRRRYRNVFEQKGSEAEVLEEGHRYTKLFLHFTREIRHVSRITASYHPKADRPWDGLSCVDEPAGGGRMVHEVHLLTGRLPWAKVTRKTRTDRDSIASFADAASVSGIAGAAELGVSGDRVGQPSSSSRVGDASESSTVLRNGIASQAPATRIERLGTADRPIELDSDDDDDGAISIASEDTVVITRVVTASPSASRNPLATITNSVSAIPDASSSVSVSQLQRPLKRLSSGQFDTSKRRPSPHSTKPSASGVDASAIPISAIKEDLIGFESTPAPGSEIGTETDMTGSSAQADEDSEEGELTAASAQKMVDSLWKSFQFFCSPKRPRYSNVFGYNTFMITLTLHLLTMLETLKHLQRDQQAF
ncbi:related to RNA-directed RNA polymerase [Melanopsichium pennsylvanicum]|uniref:RNA-dependent RNA polymerase n=1 Tax=Melanopsichium pennsylvanicum TaxID=63383 RepID=A0AAJ4XI92_9BASI|nr:related to RNA-directed RNA polymerase [Melanopsichium pennsylvanicum]